MLSPFKAQFYLAKTTFTRGLACCAAMCLLLVLPASILAQAGSGKPLQVHAADTFAAGSASDVPATLLPKGVVKLAREEQFLLWVELQNGRLHVLERNASGGMNVRQVIPVSIGKKGFGKQVEGDRKTPVGIYRLTSFLHDDQLIDFYGLGAYTLNYPSVIDRKASRTGSGIWLHGLPKDVDSRPLLDSDGCVVIDNTSFAEMERFITPGITHIVLSDEPLTWKDTDNVQVQRAGLEQAFEAWRQAWEARDNASYLAFYADDFSDFTRRKAQWDEYKARVNNSKDWITVGATNISFFADLENPKLVTVRYYQDYASSNYDWRGWKEQLWRETGDGWEIIYEGNG